MYVSAGVYQGQVGTIESGYFGGSSAVLRIGGKAIDLGNIKSVQILDKETYRKGIELFCILLLSITIVGLLIGIPWFIVSKHARITAAVTLRSGERFNVVVEDKNEWSILSRYLTT